MSWKWYPLVNSYIVHYSIHVLGWLQKWLNLITAPGSVSNEPGSVTWLATKYLKTVSWRNHTVKLTTLWPQNISFWPKIKIRSSYFTILMLNCLQNTLKLQYDSYVTAVKFLTKSISKQPDLTFQHCWNSLDSRLEYNKITHRYAKVSPFTWFLCWKLPIDTDFIHFICHLSPGCDLNARECFDGPAAPQQGMLGPLIVWWPASFWLQWTMAKGSVHTGSSAKFPTKPTEEWKKISKCML